MNVKINNFKTYTNVTLTYFFPTQLNLNNVVKNVVLKNANNLSPILKCFEFLLHTTVSALMTDGALLFQLNSLDVALSRDFMIPIQDFLIYLLSTYYHGRYIEVQYY